MAFNGSVFDLNDKAQKRHFLYGFFKEIGRKISVITALLSGLTLLGYALGVEFLYRPLADEPATNPLTALVVALIALSLEANSRFTNKKYSLSLSVTAVFVCISHLVGFVSEVDLSQWLMPFSDTVHQDVLLGKNNSMGANTTLMLLLLAISSLLYVVKRPLSSQLFSFTALCIPMVSITGYAYGLTAFYGAMSLLSTTFGVFICVSMLAITADKGGVEAILSPYIGGKIARIQISLGYFIPLIIGYLVIRSLVNSNENSIFGIYVVAICWFIALLVVVSAIVQEKVDGKRREVEQALKVSAMTDELTALPNRRHFMKAAAEKLNDSAVQGLEDIKSWFLMIDIDHFKKINDTAGHEMGDKVLVEFGKTLRGALGPQDLICRLGGEEFALLLPMTTKERALSVAHDILRSVESMEIPGYTDVYGNITTSIGGTFSDKDAGVDHALKLADEALYRSKNAGRNRVMFAM